MSRDQRDSQRARVYTAQASVAKGPEYRTVAECQKIVDTITSTRWWQERDPYRALIEVRDGRGRRNAVSYDHSFRIAIPRPLRYLRTVIHELAHQLADNRYGLAVAGHGAEFAGIYLAMVYRFIGPENGQELRAAYKRNRVRFIPVSRVGSARR